jgi:succinate-semialdehyde dehydrogenase/glutarate-semialdehyde dehydrogenase
MPFVAINPATEEVIAEYPVLSAEEVNLAIERATTAYHSWRRMTFAERGELLTRAAELVESEIPVIAELMTLEMGKTFAAAKGEAMKCAMTMRYFAEHAEAMLREENLPTKGSRSGVRFDPIGPIFAVMPWNFPWWQVIRMAVPTLMAGNVVVFKHAPNVPGNAKYLEDLFHRAGFAPGVLTSVFVDIEQVPAIIADSRIAAVTLTGSERAGRSVAEHAGRNLKKCVLELGGSDPFVIASSADLELTVPAAVAARIQNNGQACIAAKRYIVVRSRAEEFIERFTTAMADVPMGDPMDPNTVLGPLATRAQRQLLSDQVTSSVRDGAVVRTGGEAPAGPGFYYPATVLTNVPESSRAGREELFGPVAVVHVVDNLAAAIELANATPWGLGASIWSEDQNEIDAAIVGIDVGMVFANAMVVSMAELPFGGTKNSGIGRELAQYGVREFTNVKSFYVA